MLGVQSRIPFTEQYRKVKPRSSKIIFLSCEGCVTEEEYFQRVSEVYSEIKSRIQFVSVAEDVLLIPHKYRTEEQQKMLTKNRPKQLVDRIDRFKAEKEELYQFSEYPDDEFWIITDVDNNWSKIEIDSENHTTMLDEWEETVKRCREAGYHFAVSNPFFEMWLLLHHDDPNEDDKKFAVTEEHAYEKTSHYRERLRKLKVPLIKQKGIKKTDYDKEKISSAVNRAMDLHIDKNDDCPKYYATTVYLLIQKIREILDENETD